MRYACDVPLYWDESKRIGDTATYNAGSADRPRMLGKQWERWDSTAHAAERWELYRRERLTDLSGIDVDGAVARVVARGEAASAEAFREELRAVQPWRMSLDREGTLREVAKRLAAIASTA